MHTLKSWYLMTVSCVGQMALFNLTYTGTRTVTDPKLSKARSYFSIVLTER